MRHIILISFTAALISACMTQPEIVDTLPPASTHSKLAGSSWTMESDLAKNPYIEFRANGHLGGFTGCNQISGVYTETSDIKDGRHVFELGEVITTEMACPEGMAEEGKFLAALRDLRSFKFAGKGQLSLFQEDGSEIISLKRLAD